MRTHVAQVATSGRSRAGLRSGLMRVTHALVHARPGRTLPGGPTGARGVDGAQASQDASTCTYRQGTTGQPSQNARSPCCATPPALPTLSARPVIFPAPGPPTPSPPRSASKGGGPITLASNGPAGVRRPPLGRTLPGGLQTRRCAASPSRAGQVCGIGGCGVVMAVGWGWGAWHRTKPPGCYKRWIHMPHRPRATSIAGRCGKGQGPGALKAAEPWCATQGRRPEACPGQAHQPPQPRGRAHSLWARQPLERLRRRCPAEPPCLAASAASVAYVGATAPRKREARAH